MRIRLSCPRCPWSRTVTCRSLDEFGPDDMPARCPACGETEVRATVVGQEAIR